MRPDLMAKDDEKASAQTVLLVQDDVLVRIVLSEYLRDCGYRVFEAATSQEALRVLEQGQMAVDVVFADIQTPGPLDGFGLAQWVRTNKPGVKVLLVGTVQGAADAAAELCDVGPSFSRPYEPQSVVDRIKRLLAKRAAKKGR